jgi:hypothetical protein
MTALAVKRKKTLQKADTPYTYIGLFYEFILTYLFWFIFHRSPCEYYVVKFKARQIIKFWLRLYIVAGYSALIFVLYPHELIFI